MPPKNPPKTATRQQQQQEEDDADIPAFTTTPSRADISNRRRNRRPTSRITASVAQQSNVSPLRSPQPHRAPSPPPPPARGERNDNNDSRQRRNSNNRDKKRAQEWAKQLDAAIPRLLDKLFSHLSQLPEEELQQMGGVTLPASALGWLTFAYNLESSSSESSSSSYYTRDKLRLLKFLLPRITHLRIVRTQPWPPALSLEEEEENARLIQESQRNNTGTTPRHAPPPLEFFHTTARTSSGNSVCSALTTEDAASFPTRQAFMDFMQMLQERPTMDLRLFPNLKVLVLDSVPPYWIADFGSLVANQLEILRIEKACLYKLPEVFTLDEYPILTYLRFSACCVGELSQLPKLLRRLPNLQFLSLADNEIRREKTALKGLRNLTSLKKLDLSGNRLTSLPYANLFVGNITNLNLAGNALVNVQGIDKLYGLEVLDLSENQIADFACLAGLGKLPSLKELSVKGNPFLLKTPPGYERSRRQRTSSSTAGFEQEYRLLILSWFASSRGGVEQDLPILHGQPVMERELPYLRAMCLHQKYIPSKTTTTTATKIQKVRRSFKRKGRAKIQPSENLTTTREQGKLKRESIERRILEPIKVSFTVEDVLNKMYQENKTAFPEEYETPVNDENEKETDPIVEQKEEVPPEAPEKEIPEKEDTDQHAIADESSVSSCHQMQKEDTVATSKMSDLSSTTEKDQEPSVQEAVEPAAYNDSCDGERHEDEHKADTRAVQVISPKPSPIKVPRTPDANAVDVADSDQIESPSPADTSTERQLREAVTQLSMSLLLDPNDLSEVAEDQEDYPEDPNSPNPIDTVQKENGHNMEGILICDPGADNENTPVEDDTKASPKRSSSAQPAAASKESEKTPPRVATIKLTTGGSTKRQLDVFGAGWDELVELAAAGLIPDGKLKTPVESIHKAEPEEDIFAEADEEMFGPVAPQKSKLDVDTNVAAASSIATDDVSELGSMVRSITIDSTYQDDLSLPSFDASELQVQSKFQLAEENTKYDGPETCRNLNVLENMDLYFTSFVFRNTTPVAMDGESANEELVSSTEQVYPRIQLWPEDRKSIRQDETSGPGDLSESSRERCVRVWEEDVIPCGKSSLRRLGPNRNVRLTFHGEKVAKNGSLRPYAESRKVYLCMSSEALYVIARKDDVTVKKKRKKFPLPIKDKAKFADAPWPHAIARHSYHDLQTIIIGFDFQRLTLRFSSRRRSDPYSYVLLTGNKRQTVSILQEIQNLKKELDEGVEELTSDYTAVAIENDSQVVFDRLSEAAAPNMVGTIIHYQIVQQFWKHGNRGTVRRVCIVSDTKLFLLNEDYLSDGHKSLSNDGHRVGEVSYEVVDEATLAQVAEIRPADADPRSITILINPLSRLSRTHRWRLLCRDSDGAERLVADVRRAIDMHSDDVM